MILNRSLVIHLLYLLDWSVSEAIQHVLWSSLDWCLLLFILSIWSVIQILKSPATVVSS